MMIFILSLLIVVVITDLEKNKNFSKRKIKYLTVSLAVIAFTYLLLMTLLSKKSMILEDIFSVINIGLCAFGISYVLINIMKNKEDKNKN